MKGRINKISKAQFIGKALLKIKALLTTKVLLLTKVLLVISVFAQTSTADTVLPMIGVSSINEPLYLTLCGLGLLILGIKSKPSV